MIKQVSSSSLKDDANQSLLACTSSNYSSIDRHESQFIHKRTISQEDNRRHVEKNSVFTHRYWQVTFRQCTTSVYLENTGSVARDHLANERTYLAWLRTSLSTISVGIGLTQLFRLEKSMTQNPKDNNTKWINGQLIGFIFIAISILFLIFGFTRYFHSQVAMMNGYFPASRSTVLIASILLLCTMIVVLFFVLHQ